MSKPLPYRWWIASTVSPLLAAIIGPIGNMFTICSLSTDWGQCLATEDGSVTSTPDPLWLTVLKSSSTAVALLATLLLVLVMTRRVAFKTAIPLVVVGWLVSCIILLVAICEMAYYYGIFACALLAIGSIALSVNFLGACCGHYKYESKLTAPQRTLMIQVIVLTAYYLLGALVFSHIESWSFLDAFYWADLTLLTIGLGHIFTPQTTLGRGLLLPFVIFGISFVGLVIGSIRTLAFKRARNRLQPTLVRTRLKKLAKALRNRKNIIRIGPFHYLDLQKSHLDSCGSGEREFSIMRRLLDATKFESRCLSLTLSVVVFIAWWLAGAAVFMASEGWDYFEGWYFSYITFMTIGYGDYSPTTALGRAFFVLWTMFAVPALTMLISNAGDVLISGFRSIARLLGKSMGQFDNQTPPGFMPNRTLANRGSSSEVAIPPADSLAILAEIQGRHEASEAEKMGRESSSRQQRHLYAALLAWETSHLIRDAQSQRDKKYSFQEWAHFLHALGRDERLPLLASEPREGLNRVDAHDVRSRAETHLEYGWLSEASPLMASSEPEWLLEKFSRLLVETVGGYTTEQRC